MKELLSDIFNLSKQKRQSEEQNPKLQVLDKALAAVDFLKKKVCHDCLYEE